MSLCKHLRSGGRKPMREPGNRGITGQQPLGNNRSFHYLVVKGPKSALKYCVWEHLKLISVFVLLLLNVQKHWGSLQWSSRLLKTTCKQSGKSEHQDHQSHLHKHIWTYSSYIWQRQPWSLSHSCLVQPANSRLVQLWPKESSIKVFMNSANCSYQGSHIGGHKGTRKGGRGLLSKKKSFFVH